jgi:hypothetical protein
MDTKPEPIPVNLQGLADDLLLQQFSPAAVLVNARATWSISAGEPASILSRQQAR